MATVPWERTNGLCSSPITNYAPRILQSVIEQIKNYEFRIADGIAGKILAGPVMDRNFGVVELVHDPDCYRITLRLIDESGTNALTFPLPG